MTFEPSGTYAFDAVLDITFHETSRWQPNTMLQPLDKRIEKVWPTVKMPFALRDYI